MRTVQHDPAKPEEVILSQQDQTQTQPSEKLNALRHRITELETTLAKKQQEIENIKKSKARYRRFFEQAGIGMTMAGEGSAFYHSNKAFCDLFGYTREELFDISSSDLTHPAELEEDDEAIQAIYDGKANSIRRRKRYIRKDGQVIWGLLNLSCAPDENGHPLHLIAQLQDITKQVEAEQALAHRNRRLDEALTELKATQEKVVQQQRLTAVGQMAAGIAHDFNNILTSIILYTQMALCMPQLPFKIRQQLEIIVEQSTRATDLVQQLLDFGRRAVLRRESLDMSSVLQKTLRLLKRSLPENILISLSYGADDYSINADQGRVQQAIVNLALNARDAMPAGGQLRMGMDRFTLQHSQEPPVPEMQAGEWLWVTVADTGTGIAPEVLPHIFEPFFTTRAPQGPGLGVAQVYGIVKQHGGHIDVNTEVGQGTTFTLYWPALPFKAEQSLEPKQITPVRGKGEVILVVEDDLTLKATLVSALGMLNYQVLQAANGREALDIYDQHENSIELVLSDWVMPYMGGLELVQALKQRDPDVKVLMMTGHPLNQGARNSTPDGAIGWIQKPPNLNQLAELVSRALAGEHI